MVVELSSIARNTKFLTTVYGAPPDLGKVYITKISLEYGIGLDVSGMLLREILKRPQKWASGNTVSLQIKFSGISALELKYNGEVDSVVHTTEIRCEHLSSFNFRAYFSGQFVGQFDFQDARVDHFEPAQLEWAYSRPRTMDGEE